MDRPPQTNAVDAPHAAANAKSTSEHPWLTFAGMYSADDSVVQEWVAIINEQRDEPEDV